MSNQQVNSGFLTRTRQNKYVALACRLILGGVFLFAGLVKLPYEWELFIGLPAVLQTLHVPQYLWQFIQLQRLPWVEIFVGSCLVTGLLVKPAAFISVLLTLAFLIFNSVKLFHQGEWCFCFGQTLKLSLPAAQVIDITLLLMALLILFHRNIVWTIDKWLLKRLKQTL